MKEIKVLKSDLTEEDRDCVTIFKLVMYSLLDSTNNYYPYMNKQVIDWCIEVLEHFGYEIWFNDEGKRDRTFLRKSQSGEEIVEIEEIVKGS